MKYVFINYAGNMAYDSPEAWLKRINLYAGILEALALTDTVISMEHINYEGALLKNGVQYFFRPITKNDRKLPLKLHRFIKALEPDVVVIQSLHSPLQLIQLRLSLGNRPIFMVQNHAEQPFTGLKKKATQLADSYVDAYLFASREMGLKWVKDGCLARADKIYEVMEVSSVFHPVSKTIARAITGVQSDEAFLWVGRLNANKDPLTVVQAFLNYALQRPRAYLYMIYHTTELLDEIQQVIAQHPAGKQLIMVGQVPHDELLYWFNSVDFILSGSHYEGSGTAICEAMSCGCIPLVTAIDSFKMMTDHGRCGMLYQPGNQTELFNVLMQTQQMDREEKRAAVLEYYNSTLSFNAIAARFRSVAGSISR